MADVYAIFGTLIALGVAYPGMLVAWQLLFPDVVMRAQQRISVSPWGSLGIGFGAAIPVIVLSTLFLSAAGGLAKFLGLLTAVGGLAVASLGGSGLAARMGGQLNEISGGRFSVPGAHVRGAIALELAVIFPLIGWFIVFPLTSLACFGAALRALIIRREALPEPIAQASEA